MNRNNNSVCPENEVSIADTSAENILEKTTTENADVNVTSHEVEPTIAEVSGQSEAPKKINCASKQFIRRLLYGLGSAFILVVIAAIIATAVIVTKQRAITASTTTTESNTASPAIAGSTISAGTTISSGSTISAGSTTPSKSTTLAGTTTPAGTATPAGSTTPASTTPVATTTPAGSTTPASTTPASTTPASTTPAGTTTPAGSTTPAPTTPAPTTPASTTSASTTPASITPASTTPASTTPASTTPAPTTPAPTTPAPTTPAPTTPAPTTPAPTTPAPTTPASTTPASTTTLATQTVSSTDTTTNMSDVSTMETTSTIAAGPACNSMFLNQTIYSTGTGSTPYAVAIADVNSDSQPDIIVANSGSAAVGVYLNAGNGTFLNRTSYTTGTGSAPRSIAVADVNGDSLPDVVVGNFLTVAVGVLLNAGNGIFLNQTTYPTGTGSTPYAVAVVDVNSDNKSDIVVANAGTSTVGVYLNVGNGTFLNRTTYSTGAASAPRSVAVVDVNGDSLPDIVVGNYGTGTVGVLLNAGNGIFLNSTAYLSGTGSQPRSVAVVDVNSDSQPDIVVATSATNSVGVFLNAGNGIFLNQTTYSTGNLSAPRSVAVVDVNGDSLPDIVVANTGTLTVGVLLNVGNGIFSNLTTYSTGTISNPYFVAVADVNSDNKPDIVVADDGSNNVGVFLHC